MCGRKGNSKLEAVSQVSCIGDSEGLENVKIYIIPNIIGCNESTVGTLIRFALRNL